MKRLKQFFSRKKNPRHVNESETSNISDQKYHRGVQNNGFPGGHARDQQHDNNASRVSKPSSSVARSVRLIGDYIDDYNKTRVPDDRIKIDIIILEGLLDINQHLTEPESGSTIRFIFNPKERWRNNVHSENLQQACVEARWHAEYPWIPDATLKKSVREKMFQATEHDKRVYISGMRGMIIRKPPKDYQICQRVNRLGDPESNPKPSSSELNKIVEEFQNYLDHNEPHLKKEHARLKQKYQDQGMKYHINPFARDCGHRHHDSQGVIVSDKLIEKWQNDYRFNKIHLWLERIDEQSCRISLRNRAHRHLIGRVMTAKHSETGRPSRDAQVPHRSNRGHDSAISLSSDPGANQKPLPKSNSGTSNRPRRREQISPPPLSRSKPSRTNETPPPKKHPTHSAPSSGYTGRGEVPRSPPPKRLPRTPDRYQNPKNPFPPSVSQSPRRSHHNHSTRPGSSGRGIQQRKEQRDLSDSNTSPPQGYAHLPVNNHNTRNVPKIKPKKSRRVLSNTTSTDSQHQPRYQLQNPFYTQSNTYCNSNSRNEYLKHLNPQSPDVEISPKDENDDWRGDKKVPIEEMHEALYRELKNEVYILNC